MTHGAADAVLGLDPEDSIDTPAVRVGVHQQRPTGSGVRRRESAGERRRPDPSSAADDGNQGPGGTRPVDRVDQHVEKTDVDLDQVEDRLSPAEQRVTVHVRGQVRRGDDQDSRTPGRRQVRDLLDEVAADHDDERGGPAVK